jgi:hypothetical protein
VPGLMETVAKPAACCRNSLRFDIATFKTSSPKR